MRSPTLLILFITAISNAALCADALDMDAYRKCTEAGRARAAPPVVMAACKGIADNGIPAAQFVIGVTFLNADGVKSPQALEWLTRAAATGHPPAQHALAMIKMSSAVESDRSEGRELMRQSACSGFPQANQLLEKVKVPRAQLHCDDSPTNFAGTWNLALVTTKAPPAGTPKRNYRISIENDAAKVFYEDKDKWIESKPGTFRLTREGQTAVISSIDSGWDFDGQWIETWTFYLLRTGEKTAFASFVRTVNNPHLPPSLSWKAFNSFADGPASRD
jgi:hypothetical protein